MLDPEQPDLPDYFWLEAEQLFLLDAFATSEWVDGQLRQKGDTTDVSAWLRDAKNTDVHGATVDQLLTLLWVGSDAQALAARHELRERMVKANGEQIFKLLDVVIADHAADREYACA